MGFSRQEYQSGLPFPSPGDLPCSEFRQRDQALNTPMLTEYLTCWQSIELCLWEGSITLGEVAPLAQGLSLERDLAVPSAAHTSGSGENEAMERSWWRPLSSSRYRYHCVCVRSVAQSCPPLCDSMDCSLPGFSVHGIFQERIPEWVAISYYRGSSWPRDRTCISCVSCIGRSGFFTTVPPGKPIDTITF